MSGDVPNPPAGPPADEPPRWPTSPTPPPPPPGGPDHRYQQPYGQPTYYAQPPYGAPPPTWMPPVGPPKHPSAVTAMVLGIIGLGGVVLCGFGTVVAPFAWWIGHRAVSEIDADPAAFGGHGEANAGKILGIIGTVLLVLVIAYYALIIGLVAFA